MKVRALQLGYYNDVRRREGDIFVLRDKKKLKRDDRGRTVRDRDGKPEFKVISAEEQFSDRWMERVDQSVPATAPRSNRIFRKENVGEDSLSAAPPAAGPAAAASVDESSQEDFGSSGDQDVI